MSLDSPFSQPADDDMPSVPASGTTRLSRLTLPSDRQTTTLRAFRVRGTDCSDGATCSPWSRDLSASERPFPRRCTCNGDPDWLTFQRNGVNYDTFRAWEATRHLQDTFQPQQSPHELTGPLGQQFETTERMVELAATLASSPVAELPSCSPDRMCE